MTKTNQLLVLGLIVAAILFWPRGRKPAKEKQLEELVNEYLTTINFMQTARLTEEARATAVAYVENIALQIEALGGMVPQIEY